MFKIFPGFHLLENLHKVSHAQKYHPSAVAKRLFKLAFVLLVTLTLWNIPSDSFGIEGLTIVQQRVIAIFAFATLMWVLEVVSSWATSLAVIVLMLLFTSDSGVNFMTDKEVVGPLLSYKSIMGTFADPVIMLFIGGFVLAIGLTKVKLDVALARFLLKPFGTRSEVVLLGFILVTAIFSAFVSNTATAAMMLAILTPVLSSLPADGKGRIGLALSIPIAANVGGVGTPIGTPPNAIAKGNLENLLGINIGFGDWAMVMIPLALVVLLIMWFVLIKMFPFSQKNIKIEIDGEFEKSPKAYIVYITFALTI